MTVFGSRSLGTLIIWPVHLSCASFKTLCMLCIPAFFRTSGSGILPCHLMYNGFLKQLKWKWLSLFACRWYNTGLTCIQEGWQFHSLIDSAWCQACFHYASRHLHRVFRMPYWHFVILAVTSSSMCTALE